MSGVWGAISDSVAAFDGELEAWRKRRSQSFQAANATEWWLKREQGGGSAKSLSGVASQSQKTGVGGGNSTRQAGFWSPGTSFAASFNQLQGLGASLAQSGGSLQGVFAAPNKSSSGIGLAGAVGSSMGGKDAVALMTAPSPLSGVLGASLAGAGALAVFEKVFEDEKARGGGGGSPNQGERETSSQYKSVSRETSRAKAIASQAAVAAGGMPVVVKVVSRVHTGGSTANLFEYLGRRDEKDEELDEVKQGGEPQEGGEADALALVASAKVDIPVYTHDGRILATADQRKAERLDWQQDYRTSEGRQPVATYEINFESKEQAGQAMQALDRAFEGKGFVYALKGSVMTVVAQASLPVSKTVGELKAERAKGTAKDGAKSSIVGAEQARIVKQFADKGIIAQVKLISIAAKPKASVYAIQKLLARHSEVMTTAHRPLERGKGMRLGRLAEKAQQHWPEVQSRRLPVNAYHIVFSARAGTNPEAMVAAVKNFLDEKAQGHKWVVAFHPETSHVHIHVVLKARNELGRALRLTKDELANWRSLFAEKAREQGIAMFATARKEFGSSRPYSQGQAAVARKYMKGQRRGFRRPQPVVERVKHKIQHAVEATGTDQGKAWLDVAKATQGKFGDISGKALAMAAGMNQVVPFTKSEGRGSLDLQTLISKEDLMAVSAREFEAREAGIKDKANGLLQTSRVPGEQANQMRQAIDTTLDGVRPAGAQRVSWGNIQDRVASGSGDAETKNLEQSAPANGERRNAANRLIEHVANVEAARAELMAKNQAPKQEARPGQTVEQQAKEQEKAQQRELPPKEKPVEVAKEKPRSRGRDDDRGRGR